MYPYVLYGCSVKRQEMDRGMKQEQLATLKNKIRSVLMSKKGGVTAANFSGEYSIIKSVGCCDSNQFVW